MHTIVAVALAGRVILCHADEIEGSVASAFGRAQVDGHREGAAEQLCGRIHSPRKVALSARLGEVHARTVAAALPGLTWLQLKLDAAAEDAGRCRDRVH